MPSNRIGGGQDGTQIGDGRGRGRNYGIIVPVPFDVVGTLGAGVAVTTIQGRLYIPVRHRVHAVRGSVSAYTAVTPGTDPTFDVYRSLPVPTALTGALESPAVAGNVENGAHLYVVANLNAAGTSVVSPSISVTVVDKTVNGKVRLTVPLGPTGTTSRKIYRTEAAGTALKLLTTISDNTTTTYLDNTADASLTTAVPTADASGVTVLTGTVKFSLAASDRKLVDQVVSGTLTDASDPTPRDPCMYTLRALTGASTGAGTDLKVYLEVEYLA